MSCSCVLVGFAGGEAELLAPFWENSLSADAPDDALAWFIREVELALLFFWSPLLDVQMPTERWVRDSDEIPLEVSWKLGKNNHLVL